MEDKIIHIKLHKHQSKKIVHIPGDKEIAYRQYQYQHYLVAGMTEAGKGLPVAAVAVVQ